MAFVAGVALLMAASSASGTVASTDFGIREFGKPAQPKASVWRGDDKPVNLSTIASLGSQWGRVTSTRRSREHNRRVGGVRNSFHLAGRAIDIARRAGVSHSAIAAAFRNAGYRLIESLDEGDHSHFAFGSGGAPKTMVAAGRASSGSGEATQWRVVAAP